MTDITDEQIIRLAYQYLPLWDEDHIRFARAVLALQPSASAVPSVEQAIEALKVALRDSKGWNLGFSDALIWDAIDRTAAREQEATTETDAHDFAADEASATGAERIVIREDRFSEHRDTRKVPQHHGDCFGVTVTPRKDAGDLVELFVEDDEFWHFVTAFDVHWLPELTRVLGLATPTTSTTGKVDVEQMLRDCVPGGSSCDPQAICDDIRNWFANGGKNV